MATRTSTIKDVEDEKAIGASGEDAGWAKRALAEDVSGTNTRRKN